MVSWPTRFKAELHGRPSLTMSFPSSIDCWTDFRMQLSATDYGNFLANETPPISTSTIAEKATQKLVDEFNYIRSNSVQPLTKFLDYMTSVESSRFEFGQDEMSLTL